MTKILSSQLEPEMIIGRALKQGETLVPLRNLISIIHSEVEAEAVGYFILNSCYTKNYKESLLTYEDDVDDKKRLEALRHGPAKRVPWRNNICLARIDTNYYPSDGIHIVNIEDNEGILIAGSTKFNEDETFVGTEPDDELPVHWERRGTCPKLYTYGDAFVFQNIRPDIINTQYLLRALTSEEVNMQVENIYRPSFANGTVGYTEEDFLSLAIPVPSLEEQKFLVDLDYNHINSSDCKMALKKYLRVRMKNIEIIDAKMELLSLLYGYAGGSDEKVSNSLPIFCDGILTEREMLVIKHFSKDVFDYIFTPLVGSKNEFFDVPNELSDFMFNLLNLNNGGKEVVYNPFVKFGSLAQHDAIFEGEEIDEKAWAVAKARLCIAGIENNLTLGNPLDDYGKRYKYILSMLPYGRQGEVSLECIVSTLYEKMELGGRMVVGVPFSFLKGTDRLGIRQRLLADEALCEIYVLPEYLMKPATAVRLAVLVINKGGTNCHGYDKVRMIDFSFAKKINYEGNGANVDFDIKAATEAYEQYCLGFEDRSGISVIEIPFTQLLDTSFEREYVINPLVYFATNRIRREKKDANFVRLGDLVELNHENRVTDPMRIVDLACFPKEGIILESDFEKLPLTSPVGPCRILNCDGLLLSGVKRGLKCICFKRNDKFPVAYSSDRIFSLKLKSKNVGLEFLACELNGADYVNEQIDALTSGSVLLRLRSFELMNILVDVPSLEEQVKRIESYKSAELDRLLGEKGREIKMQHEDFVRRVRSRKHAIGNVMGEVVPAFDGLVDCFNEHGGKLTESDLVWKGFDDTVGSVIAKLQKEICRVAEMVSNMTNAVDVEFGTPDEFVVKDLVEDYISSHVFNRCTVRMNYNEEAFAEALGERNEVAIKVCKDDFNKILDNIVTNAVKHGFTDEGKTYYIEFDVAPTIINGCLAVGISVRNNGNPLPKGMTVEKVFQEGQSTSGSFGIGGWFIKSAVEQFGGEVDMNLFDPEENDFSIEYVLKFPISNL